MQDREIWPWRARGPGESTGYMEGSGFDRTFPGIEEGQILELVLGLLCLGRGGRLALDGHRWVPSTQGTRPVRRY